jgi:exonuclease III
MKIVTYNLEQGGKDFVHWRRVIEVFNPDLFLVQETAPPDQHLRPDEYGDLGSRAVWRPAGVRSGWGTTVYVKRGELRSLDLGGFDGRLVGVAVDGLCGPTGRPLLAFSLHAPDEGCSQLTVGRMLDLIARHAGDADVVIGGDFNLTVSDPQPGEQLRTTYTRNMQADGAIRARLREKFGLVSCWRSKNPSEPLAQTLRVGGNPHCFHVDGIFVPASWLPWLRSCTVVCPPAWTVPSDHNPVVAEFRDAS